MRIKIAKQARRHKMGQKRILAVMSTQPVNTDRNTRGEVEYRWVADVDGFTVEVVAVEATDDRNGEPILLVLHAMPNYRK